MVGRIVLILLLAAVAQARGATEVQGAMIKGTVILNGEGGAGVANIQITDSAHTASPTASDSDGGFTLDYPNRAPGERVRLQDVANIVAILSVFYTRLELTRKVYCRWVIPCCNLHVPIVLPTTFNLKARRRLN